MKTFNLLFIIIYLFVSCTKNPVAIESNYNFSIHFLKDSTITIDQLHNMNLADVELDPTPWLSSKDIEFYDYSTHFIYLKTSIKDYYPDFNNSNVNIGDWHFRPFVVCGFTNACYAGCLHINICSHRKYDVCILDREIDENDDNDVLRIGNLTPSIHTIPQSAEDVRQNTNIKNALIEDGIYHAGLEVKLDNVKILENSDTATVQYSFTIINNDQDNLYAISSDLIEKDIFDIAVTLVFINEFDKGILPIGYKSLIDYDVLINWESSWFISIASRQSITQTVIRKYPEIPTGHYYCKIYFQNRFKITKNERMLPDGRYWLGEVMVEPIEINVN